MKREVPVINRLYVKRSAAVPVEEMFLVKYWRLKGASTHGEPPNYWLHVLPLCT